VFDHVWSCSIKFEGHQTFDKKHKALDKQDMFGRQTPSKRGVALERKYFFGRSERPKKIGNDQFFWVCFPVAHGATRQG